MKTLTLKNKASYYFRFTVLFLIISLVIYLPYIVFDLA